MHLTSIVLSLSSALLNVSSLVLRTLLSSSTLTSLHIPTSLVTRGVTSSMAPSPFGPRTKTSHPKMAQELSSRPKGRPRRKDSFRPHPTPVLERFRRVSPTFNYYPCRVGDFTKTGETPRTGGTHVSKTNPLRQCRSQRDVVFLLDFSGSVDKTYDAIVALLRETVYGLPFKFGRTRVGMLTYNDNAKVAFHLNKYSEQRDVLNAIAFYQSGGRTNTQEALRVASDVMLTSGNGDRSSVENVVVLVTDGGSNISRDQTSARARALRSKPSTSVYVVAVGDQVDLSEVNDIVGGDTRKVYRMQNANDAPTIASDFLTKLC
ncbi:hypothetical protein NP493_444g02053 [Ridgeia piscesae]|uniref:VWFA domain-containing protein n=1 Tax=Ridgeia piscesae TaxID=27915 RepID=A0AAD9KZZ7_RIDPI|nr:hypothetical protein NP493_444g02053 [Ridgeia piscesae]